MSDREKKKAEVFDETFLRVFCSQIGIYTASDSKLLMYAAWIIIGWFGGFRPIEQYNLTQDDLRPDLDGKGTKCFVS